MKTEPTTKWSSKISALRLPILAWELHELWQTMSLGLPDIRCPLLYDKIPSNVPDEILSFHISLVAKDGQKIQFGPMRCQQNLLQL